MLRTVLIAEQISQLQAHCRHYGSSVASCLAFQHDAFFAIAHTQTGVFVIMCRAPAHVFALIIRPTFHTQTREECTDVHVPTPYLLLIA